MPRKTPAEQWATTIAEWEPQSFPERALRCATFLLVHGFISDSERERIHTRMVKFRQKAEAD